MSDRNCLSPAERWDRAIADFANPNRRITVPDYMKAKTPVKKHTNVIRARVRSVLPSGSFTIDPKDIEDTRKTQQNALSYGQRHNLKIKTRKQNDGGLKVWVNL